MKLPHLFLIVALSGSVKAQRISADSASQPLSRTTNPVVQPQTGSNRLPRNSIRINPLSLALGQLSLFYERALTDSLSIVIGYGNAGILPNLNDPLERGSATYQRATLEARYYWKGKVMSGFYVGPYLRLTRLTESYTLVDGQGRALKDSTGATLPPLTHQLWVWVPGVLVGHQWRIRRFSLDSFLGLQLQLSSSPIKGGNQAVEGMTHILAPRLGLSLGMAF